MRDLKDYITQSKGGVPVNPGSPFNIKEDSALLENFSRQDITDLFAQRTAETGQQITQEALDYVWELSQGQPWMVNNFFKRATMRILDRDSTETVTKELITEARKQMVDARETHLDALMYRLRDPRILRVVQAIFTGENDYLLSREDDDVRLALDLGLIRYDNERGWIISNPVYTEILMRFLNVRYQDATPPASNFKWQKEDGSLDMDSLLKEFQKFWRRHSELWEGHDDYTEAFPHLLLLAFLQRLFNGGGNIEREVAAGSGRMDLYVNYKDEYHCIIEIKMLRDYNTLRAVREEGIEQTLRYRDKFGKETPAYLVIFDRRSAEKKADWDSRLTWDTQDGITIIGA
jgi:hypothetical protein